MYGHKSDNMGIIFGQLSSLVHIVGTQNSILTALQLEDLNK